MGAPWVRRGVNGRPFFAGAGNRGLSLRRVESFLREPRFCCHKWRAHDPELWEPYLLA
jgi:hypothetical protein